MREPPELEPPDSIQNPISSKKAVMSPEYWVNKSVNQAEYGNRNDTGFELACQLRDNGMSMSEAIPYMFDYATRVPDASHPSHPYEKLEAIASLKNAYRRESRKSCYSTKSETDMPFSIRMDNALRKINDKLMTPIYRGILKTLAEHSDWDGDNIFVSMRTLEKETGYSINTVQRSIHKLKRLDLLDIEVIYKDHEPGQFHHKFTLRFPMESEYFRRFIVSKEKDKEERNPLRYGKSQIVRRYSL